MKQRRTVPLRGSSGPKRSHSGRPPREVAEQLYGRILDSAAVLFTKHGYGETSIEAVATHAGVGKLTLYRRFGDKDELFQAVALRLREQCRMVIAEIDDAKMGLSDVLVVVGLRLLEVVLSPPSLAFHRILFAEAVRLPELCGSVLAGESPEDQGPIRQVFHRFTACGALRGHDAAFLGQQFTQAIIGSPLRNALLGAPAMKARTREDHVRKVVKLFLDGAAGPSSPK